MQALKKMPLDLKGMPVMLSASIPETLMQTPRAQECYTAVVVIVRRILSAGGRIVFGGHPTITPLVHRVASMDAPGLSALDLFQLRRFEKVAPAEINDRNVFGSVNWIGDASGKKPVGEELGVMREMMAQASQAAIFIGGKTHGYSGDRPGVRDEHEIFLESRPEGPVYLIGLLDGETTNIIRDLELKNDREPNGLTDKEQKVVRHSQNIDLIVSLIVEDLEKYTI